jgi:hypothetical protein
MHDSARAGTWRGPYDSHWHCPIRWCHCSQRRHRTLPAFGKINQLDWLYNTINLKVKHWGLSNLPLCILNGTKLYPRFWQIGGRGCQWGWTPDSGKSGVGAGVDPRSPTNRGWDPHPRSPAGGGDRGFRALCQSGAWCHGLCASGTRGLCGAFGSLRRFQK